MSMNQNRFGISPLFSKEKGGKFVGISFSIFPILCLYSVGYLLYLTIDLHISIYTYAAHHDRSLGIVKKKVDSKNLWNTYGRK